MALENQVSEIVYRATTKILAGAHPSRIVAIADPLIDAVVDMVVSAGNDGKQGYEAKLESYIVWELWNQILDEIEKEIPVAGHITVVLKNPATRVERMVFNSGTWRDTLRRPKGE